MRKGNPFDSVEGIHESLPREVWAGFCMDLRIASIAVAETMFLPTELAQCGWLSVVYQMMDGFECAQIGEDGS